MARNEWVRVSRQEPCAICEKPDWCQRTADGTACHCMRIKSDKEARKGGWIHELGETQMLAPVQLKQPRVRPKIDWDKRAHELSGVLDSWRCGELAASLGVSPESLAGLLVGCGHDDWRKVPFYSFPMFTPSGRVCGITRRYPDGSKKTMEHSRAGLYYSSDWQDVKGPVLIVEGASDVAACITLGLCAIGRNSNTGGANMLAAMLRNVKRPIVVLGECDEHADRRGVREQCPADCTGCAYCWPGKYGAEHTAAVLSEKLNRRIHWRLPPAHAKDVRDYLNQGGEGESLLNQLWRP